MHAENQSGSGFEPAERPRSTRTPSVLALIGRGYAVLFWRPLRFCACAFHPVWLALMGLAGVIAVAGEISPLAALGILIVMSSRFVVDWQESVLADGQRPAKMRWLLDLRDIKTAGLLLAVLAPAIGAVSFSSNHPELFQSMGARWALACAAVAGVAGLFSLLGLAFPAIAGGNERPWRATRALTRRLAATFAVTSILAGTLGVLLLVGLAYALTTTMGASALAGEGVAGSIAFLLLLVGVSLGFLALVVAPPSTVLALGYGDRGLEIRPLQTLPAGSQRPGSGVLSLATDREQQKQGVKGTATLITLVAVLLWAIESKWALLVGVPLVLQLSYLLLYQLSVVLVHERIEVDDQTIRWVSVFDEAVVFLRDIAEVQVRSGAVRAFVLCIVFADLDRAFAHDFYRRLAEPRGVARAVLALHRWAAGIVMHMDMGALKGLKEGRLPSGLGRRVDLYLEGDAALLKDTCRFNFEKSGMHLAFVTLSPNALVMECARELDRRRKAAIAAAAAPSGITSSSL